MSATYRRGSALKKCHASGQHYCNWAGKANPDEAGMIPCPECGKEVKLRAIRYSGPRFYIPAHNVARPSEDVRPWEPPA